MEKFDNSCAGFFRVELFVALAVAFLLATVGVPGILKFVGKVKLNSAIDSAYSYKESVSKYYISQLMIDSGFKLNGDYIISDGSLVLDDDKYDVLVTGNMPSSGYLNYENNVLKDGCVIVNGYSIFFVDGNISYDDNSVCDIPDMNAIDVAIGM